jgi:hypothetical protein
MCDDITDKYYNIAYVKAIRKLVDKCPENPKLIIEKLDINNISLNIIQEGYLVGGTKQRAIQSFIKKILSKNKKIKTLLYTGTSNGFGAVACAYAAYKLGLKSHVFLSESVESFNKKNYDTRQINTLHALNAQITICNDFRKARDLEYELGFKNTKVNNWIPKEEYYIPPMGFNDVDGLLIDILSKQIKKAMKNTLLSQTKNPRIWLVAGSGGILMSLHKAIPNAYFLVMLKGGFKYKKAIIEWASKFNNIKIFNSNMREHSKDTDLYRKLFYSSIEDYDYLIFPYLFKYSKSGDFVWNISSSDYIF